jgi:hypothetical protein
MIIHTNKDGVFKVLRLPVKWCASLAISTHENMSPYELKPQNSSGQTLNHCTPATSRGCIKWMDSSVECCTVWSLCDWFNRSRSTLASIPEVPMLSVTLSLTGIQRLRRCYPTTDSAGRWKSNLHGSGKFFVATFLLQSELYSA